MTFRQFDTLEIMTGQAVVLLKKHMQLQWAVPHAVMLSGGRTPRPVYQSIADDPIAVSDRLHVCLSDERLVPENSPDSNFGWIAGMISALGLSEIKALKVHTELPLGAAADRYDRDIAEFFERGGRLSLVLLGLGSDGHTASLFTDHDLERARNRYAIAVPRSGAPDRVSVTPDTIVRADSVVFLAAGHEKAAIVETMQTAPESVMAGRVVKHASDVELWFAKEA